MDRRLTAELDSSRAAQATAQTTAAAAQTAAAAAQSTAQSTERGLREENEQLKADRDAALLVLRLKAAAAAAAAPAAAAATVGLQAAAAPAPAAAAAASSLQTSQDFSGRFLVASVEAAPEGGHDPAYLRQLLRSLLGMALLLRRQLVLPAALCSCRDIQGLAQCEGQPEP